MNDDINIYKEQEEENAREMLQAMKETSDAHKIDEPEEDIKEKVYITECQKCGVNLFTEAKALTYSEREKFGCSYKVLNINHKYLCPTCVVDFFWSIEKQIMEV